jgi:hypothetical protein
VVDHPELRNLLLYLNANLEDGQIPHRSKLMELIMEQYQFEYDNMISDIKVCIYHMCRVDEELLIGIQDRTLGRISFTSDLWTDINQKSYMAVTAHYCALDARNHLAVESRLVAFRHVEGAHDGENLSNVFIRILEEIHAINRVRETISLRRILH